VTKPSHGVRIEVARREGGAADAESFVYRGFAETERARFELEIVVDRSAARARIEGLAADPALGAKIEKLAAALVRAATRAELEAGRDVPRKIVRWRGLDEPS
jgi:hypothetical protein